MVVISKIQVNSRDTRHSGNTQATILHICVFACTCGVTLPAVSDGTPCAKNQTAEVGQPGQIHCNLPEDFYKLYWYDNVSDDSSFVIQFSRLDGVKSGPGFESEEYSVDENGSLIIRNVTTWHERMYRVIILKQSSLSPYKAFISLIVTASPNHDSPIIGCQNCYDGYYHHLVEGETLSCSFSAARPPVQLEWFYQSGDRYDRVEMQFFNITENTDGTYNSLATLQSLSVKSNLICSLVCRATWSTADWRREKEVLIDFSGYISFSDISLKTQVMEVNRYAAVPCGESSSVYVIWKKITSNGNPELVGFRSHIMTRTVLTSALDIEVSADGSLVFLSPRVHHEGIYACISGDWLNEEIQKTSVEILIPPSPPYIQITGCDDISHTCFLNETTTKELECAVYGVRPAVTLEWTAQDANQISFFNPRMDSKEKGDTFDTILSVEYEVSQDVLCGEEIFVQCNLCGPLSKIMKPDSKAIIFPASCKKIEESGHNEFSGGWVPAICVGLVVLCIGFSVMYFQTKVRRQHTQNKGNGQPAGPAEELRLQNDVEGRKVYKGSLTMYLKQRSM